DRLEGSELDVGQVPRVRQGADAQLGWQGHAVRGEHRLRSWLDDRMVPRRRVVQPRLDGYGLDHEVYWAGRSGDDRRSAVLGRSAEQVSLLTHRRGTAGDPGRRAEPVHDRPDGDAP